MSLASISKIYSMRLRILHNKLITAGRHSRLKIVVVWLMVIGLFTGTFYVPYRAFLFLNSMGHLGLVVIDRLIYLFFLGLFFMLVFSNCIVCYSTAYKARETTFFFSLPVEHSEIFLAKFIDSITLSSWMFLCFLVPILSAYAVVRQLSLFFYASLILFFIPFAVVSGAVGCLITMLIVRFFSQRMYRIMSFVIAFAFLAGCVWLAISGRKAAQSDNEVLFLLSNLIPHFGLSQVFFMPNFWISEGIFKCISASYAEAAFWWLLLLANAMFLSQVLIMSSKRLYYRGWLKCNAQTDKRRYAADKDIIRAVVERFFFIRPALRSLIVKDIKTFCRDPLQWSQFTIFFGLLAIYFANIRNLGYQNVLPFWKNLISFLNLASTNLTLASLSVRFVFPQLSLEGKRFWILGLAPLKKEGILVEKFWLNSTVALCISLPLIILSNSMLNVSAELMVLSILVVVLMCFSLTSICLGLGTIFPNFKEDNPAQIVSGFGGTLALVLCLVYITVSIMALALPFHLLVTAQITHGFFKRLMILAAGFVFMSSLLTIFICLRGSYRSLKKLEF